MLALQEEELNKVAGGNMFETQDDSLALSSTGYLDRDYSVGELLFHWVEYSARIDAAWAKAGITSVTKPFGSNQYFIKGEEITRDDAWRKIGFN